MIKITNGKDTALVTRGAFEGIFKKQGYKVVTKNKKAKEVAPDGQEEQTEVEVPIEEMKKDEIVAKAKELGFTAEDLKGKNVAEVKEILIKKVAEDKE